jgi:hypothetical protein
MPRRQFEQVRDWRVVVVSRLTYNLATFDCGFNVMVIDLTQEFGSVILADLDPMPGPIRQALFTSLLQIENNNTLIGMGFRVSGIIVSPNRPGQVQRTRILSIQSMERINAIAHLQVQAQLQALPNIVARNVSQLIQELQAIENGSGSESSDESSNGN